MKTFAILIDAGFVKAKLGSAGKPISAKDIEGLVGKIRSNTLLQGKYLYRVYYYDAPPYTGKKRNPLDGAITKFGDHPLAIHNNALIDDLKTVDNFALRMGEIRFRGWEIDQNKLRRQQQGLHVTPGDLRPALQQKGVDMRIGLDIASMALKKQVDLLVLVTGDSDFVPPMKFARREGLQFIIVTLGHHVHPDLLEHADYSLVQP